ncbi:MAG: DUF1501 domain-containing protein, partial [Gemmatales bacterium]|nr:DUF1501 domain-containing protein [Gemmatales bacterium]MDW8387801.1 DUF1501 domain-containing protein [Gemmatales bacterium]
ILIDLFGGPSHLDTFDPKPNAPAEVRGEFDTIPTVLPGIRVTEHLPLLAKRLDKCALVRTVSHRYNSHNPYAVMTGFDGGQDQMDYFAKPSNHPSVPSVCQYLGVGRGRDLPGYVMLPAYPGYSQGLRRAGPYGGYLGPQWDPLFATADNFAGKDINDSGNDFYNADLPLIGEPRLPKLEGDLTLDVLDRRRTLIGQLEDRLRVIEASAHVLRRNAAFNLLISSKARLAFDLSREPEPVRDRYGRDLFGQSVLLARRLVEAGVTFVTVHTEAKPNGHWDTHENNFNMLKKLLLPFLDRAVSALLDDLSERSLLESTLVLVTGDMGRTPKVNGKAGRDHWPQCGFALFAGGGTRPGVVFGTTDKIAAYPTDYPVSMGDLAATVYYLVGIDPESTVPDQTARPIHISHGGRPIWGILA